MWVSSYSDSTVEYLAAQLTSSGSPVPNVVLSPSPEFGPSVLAFDSSGNLWAPTESGVALLELSASQLTSSGDPTPAVTITSVGNGPLTSPYGLAVDRSGNLWESNYEGDSVNMYTPAQLQAGGALIPTVALDGISGSAGLGFDRFGDLWVANYDSSTLSEYTPSQLTATGTPTPVVTITSNGSSLFDAEELTFDPVGNLWVTSANHSNYNVEEFTPAQLATSGDPTPAVTLSTNGSNSLDYPTGLGFDSAGNLWVSNDESGTLVAFTPAQYAVSGDPTPAVTIASDGASPASLSSPWQLGFDANGNLWVAQEGNHSVAGYTPNQLATSGNPVPADMLTGVTTSLGDPAGLAIGQPPSSGYWLAASDGGMFSEGAAGFYGSLGNIHLNQPIVGMAATPDGKGYWLVSSDGGIFAEGDAKFFGSLGNIVLNKPIVGMAATPDGKGYWLVSSDGGIFAEGDAGFYGSLGNIVLNKPIVGMATTRDGKGYWLVSSDGGIFAEGDAGFFGSLGNIVLNKPIVGMAGL
jgi:sugar lactone lactonase YvrE